MTISWGDISDNTTLGNMITLVKSSKVKCVYVLPNFGCNETWVKISKSQALKMLNTNADGGEMLTAKDLQLYTGSFGNLDLNKTLWLG